MALAATGVVVVASAVVHLAALDATASLAHRVVTLCMIGGAGMGFLYWGVSVPAEGVGEDQGPRVAAWTLGTVALFVALGTVSLYVGSERVRVGEFVEIVHLTGSVGLLAGVLVGATHARAVANAETAARAGAEAAALDAERDRLEQLNGVLRHYVLNGTNVILGATDRLEDVVPADERAVLDRVESRARMMAILVDHVRTIQGIHRPSTSLDLDEVVAAAAARADPPADVTVSTPATGATVETSEPVETGVTLLCEAVLHCLEPGGQLTLTGVATDDEVTITVEASPATLPASLEGSLFEPTGSETGLEFYLVDQLVGEDGEIRLTDRTGETLRFEMRLSSVGMNGE